MALPQDIRGNLGRSLGRNVSCVYDCRAVGNDILLFFSVAQPKGIIDRSICFPLSCDPLSLLRVLLVLRALSLVNLLRS